MDKHALIDIRVEFLKHVAKGKVRELYEVESETLLVVASDRISAYDVIMANGIPLKGIILTLLSAHWCSLLQNLIPNLRTHFITLDLPDATPESQRHLLQNRSMQVGRFKVFPIEAIVRGYLTGSAWKEYQKSGTVHTIPIQNGLRKSEKFPDGPIYTPSTKAEAGKHDENISPARASELIGAKYAKQIEDLSLKIYEVAREYAADRGIIIADAKFEFGLDEERDEIVLIDEVLTPDSSRFWPLNDYTIGTEQQSYDKQYLRNWLSQECLEGKEGVSMPQEVIDETAKKYKIIYEKLTGHDLERFLKV
ncbi:Phosphoribosylaminoimidazole-succinocarboxamide synthase [Podosphaera aphanis]|nr:Phosphoribosylaminoimidazole-succinocarboxamide synthase [Podosphaera aphanis]